MGSSANLPKDYFLRGQSFLPQRQLGKDKEGNGPGIADSKMGRLGRLLGSWAMLRGMTSSARRIAATSIDRPGSRTRATGLNIQTFLRPAIADSLSIGSLVRIYR
jgi:hypothetical protein